MAFSSALYLLLLVITVSESKPQIGGTEAADGAYPYVGSLRNAETMQHFCGCSIISPNWILTAAHCVNEYDQVPYSINVVVGTNRVDSGGTAYDAVQIIYHEAYNSDTAHNDIAVVEVEGPMTFGPKVQSIPMATSNLQGGSSVVSCGWGLTNAQDMNGGATTLQTNRLTSMSIQQCKDALPGNPIVDTQMCTKGVAGKGACDGDSGGPLSHGYVQYGIASFVVPPCGSGDPDYYTNVASFRPWIQDKTGL